MSDITDIVSEFRTVSTAHSDIETFKYAYPGDINADRNIKYPLVVLSKEHPYNYSPTFSGKHRIYTLKLFVLDLYQTAEQGTKAPEDKKTELENYAEQILREIVTRSKGTGYTWSLENESVTADHFDRSHNDSLIGVELEFRMNIFTG